MPVPRLIASTRRYRRYRRRRMFFACVRFKDRRLAPEAPDGAVDAEEQLPRGFGNRREALEAAARVAAPEHDDRSRQDDQRAPDEPEPRPRPWHELCAVHHVPEDQSVSPADDPTGPEDERPVLDRRKRVSDGAFGRACRLVPQGDDGDHRDDADEDERALDNPRRHVADRQLLVAPPHDRNDHDRGADVGDDQQQLQERAEQDRLVVPATGDVAHGMPEHRLVESERRDRRDEGDEVEHAEPARSLLVRRHADQPLSPADGSRPIPTARQPARARKYALQAHLSIGRRTHLLNSDCRPRGEPKTLPPVEVRRRGQRNAPVLRGTSYAATLRSRASTVSVQLRP